MLKLVRICLSSAMSALLAGSVAAQVAAQPDADAQQQFQVAVTLVDDYRDEVLELQTEVVDAPALALMPTFDLTITTMKTLRDMEVDGCFAEWWANEYVSLKLGAMFTLYMQEESSDQLKVDHTGWLADRLHQDAQTMREGTFDACA